MMAPEDPPGFVVRTEAQKAAWENGFRTERGIKSGWLHFGSTTARGEIWIGGMSPRRPWVLSIDHPGVAAELVTVPSSPLPGPASRRLSLRPSRSSMPCSTAFTSSR